MITLNNGLSINSLSNKLGHKPLKITQHFAIILDGKVSDNMAVLKFKLDNSTNSNTLRMKKNEFG